MHGVIESKIGFVREKVLLDADLAGPYGVTAMVLGLRRFKAVFDAVRPLMASPEKPKHRIGF
jgi:hypothetical protein